MASSDSKPSLLIAFGGNALNVPDAPHPHQKEEFLVARRSMMQLVPLLKQGWRKIIITHGNGPQVGQIFLQQELTVHEFPRQITLDVCVADSKGRIGYILQNVFDNVCQEQGLDLKSFTVITQVRVDRDDPGFQNPTKPIGVFYEQAEAERLERERGWVLKEDAGRGFRRMIASPEPLEVIEKNAFRHLLDLGFIVIGAGGGGIPVCHDAQGQLEGLEAVIDKDRTSALLANTVGIDWLVILTQVPHACLDFNTPREQPIHYATVAEMERWLAEGHFLEGSMKPKVESAIRFLRNGGKRAIIAHLNELERAVAGTAGTQVTVD